MVRPFEYNHLLKQLNKKYAAFRQLLQIEAIETMPQWVSFQNTHVCNLRCPHCQTHGTEEGRRHCNNTNLDMDLQFLSRVAKETLVFADEFTLTLTGEPLATRGLEYIIQILGSYGAKMDLITNGTLLTAAKLPYLIPFLKRVQFSFDAVTPHTFESIRLGAKFKNVVNNIKLFTVTCELLPLRLRPEMSLSFTIMGSNIQELPEIVSLASYLGIPVVNGAFVQIFYDNLCNESIDGRKAQYNAYHLISMKKANDLGIKLNIPPLFNSIAPNIEFADKRDLMIIKNLPEDYDPKLPDMSQFVDISELNQIASEIALQILGRETRGADELESAKIGSTVIDMLKGIRHLTIQYGSILNSKYNENDQWIKYCDYLYKTLYVFPSGDVSPCCMVGAPVLGNLNIQNARDNWNGNLFNTFRKMFFSEEPAACCKGCKFAIAVDPRRFYDEIFSLPSVEVADWLYDLQDSTWYNILIRNIQDVLCTDVGKSAHRNIKKINKLLSRTMEPFFLRVIKEIVDHRFFMEYFIDMATFVMNLYLLPAMEQCGDMPDDAKKIVFIRRAVNSKNGRLRKKTILQVDEFCKPPLEKLWKQKEVQK